jgi:serine/threonine-protein kinase RsbW
MAPATVAVFSPHTATISNRHNGVEVNYAWTSSTDTTTHLAHTIIRTSFPPPMRRWSPFVLAWLGALIFDPTNVAGANTQTRPAFAYGGGADFNLAKRLFVRAKYRGLVYNSPKYDLAGLNGFDRVTHRAEPSVGFGWRFCQHRPSLPNRRLREIERQRSARLNFPAALRKAPMIETHDIERATSNSSSAPFVELHQAFPSSVAAISPFADQLMRFIKRFTLSFGSAKETEDEVEIAIYEALTNAVTHGNQENPEKQVHVACRCSMDGELLITVRDEGEGFDSRAVPDPTEAQRLLLTHGRGLHLMRALMDEVSFEENGRVVRMRKRTKAHAHSL